MSGDQREHYKFCTARFQQWDDQLEVEQDQLVELWERHLELHA